MREYLMKNDITYSTHSKIESFKRLEMVKKEMFRCSLNMLKYHLLKPFEPMVMFLYKKLELVCNKNKLDEKEIRFNILIAIMKLKYKMRMIESNKGLRKLMPSLGNIIIQSKKYGMYDDIHMLISEFNYRIGELNGENVISCSNSDKQRK